jgi:hypothetical protein
VLKLRQQFDRYSPFRPPRILSDRRHLDKRAKRYSVGRSVACLSAHASPPGLILHVKSGSTRVWRSSFLPVRRCSFCVSSLARRWKGPIPFQVKFDPPFGPGRRSFPWCRRS